MPQPEVERRDVSAPESAGQVGKVGKVGSASRVQFMAEHGAPENDRMDLNSNPVGTEIQRFD
jgi:hypothetical protein